MFVIGCAKPKDTPEPEKKFFDFNMSEMQLRTGEQQAVALREGITNYPFSEITYQSMDENIAKIVDKETIHAVAAGSTTIQAIRRHVVLDSFKIKIINGVVTAIAIVPATTTLKKGLTLQLNPLLTPAIAVDKSLIWASSDPTVAAVTQTGKVTALKPGVATIFATTVTNLTMECIVTVE